MRSCRSSHVAEEEEDVEREKGRTMKAERSTGAEVTFKDMELVRVRVLSLL